MKCRFILQHCRFYKIESFKVDYCKKNFRQKTKGMKWISWEIWHFAGREIGRTQFFSTIRGRLEFTLDIIWFSNNLVLESQNTLLLLFWKLLFTSYEKKTSSEWPSTTSILTQYSYLTIWYSWWLVLD